MKFDNTDTLCVNTLRTLSIDMVGKADSGHPGLPLGAGWAVLAFPLLAGLRRARSGSASPSATACVISMPMR